MRAWKLPILVLLILLMANPLTFAAPSPLAEVQTTVDQVITVLRDKALVGADRRATLSKLIRARFDFSIMSQRTLGQNWKQASATEQQKFVALFSDLLEASYIGRIEAYSNETVAYLGERVEGDRAAVDTRIQNGSAELPISYRMVLQNGGWFVYDVVIEDVSLIRNYRNSYGEIVRKEGFAGLFKRMEEKIRELQAAPASTAKG